MENFEKRFSKTTKKIIIGGHSRGGALATLASIDFKLAFPNLHFELVTMGSPRVGNKRFVEEFHKLYPNGSKRFVVRGDPVTMISIKKGFFHVPTEIFLEENPLKKTISMESMQT